MLKKVLSLIILMTIMLQGTALCEGEEINLSCKSAVLIEKKTGKVLYEKNPDEPLPPASITKIMTLLLIMEDINEGKFTFDDKVTASERAKSMGGSTIFLDTGEVMTVSDLVKGIAVASANDACVAMAEFIEGSVEAFVERMNKRAKELSMESTVFRNTNGLPDPEHKSTASDIAKMSKALLSYPEILSYTTIWTDSLRNGEFLLANTNKLIRFYDGATGLKTGSTDEAGCCISASAKRDNLELIAVVLGAPTSNDRFSDARALLDYGFSKVSLFEDSNLEEIKGKVKVVKGKEEEVSLKMESGLYYLKKRGNSVDEEIITEIPEQIEAPVIKGQKIGKIYVKTGGEIVSESNLIAAQDVGKIGFFKMYKNMLKYLLRLK